MVFFPLIFLLFGVISASDPFWNRTCEQGYQSDVPGFIDYWFLSSCVTKNDAASIFSLVVWMLFLGYLLISTQQYFAESVSRISTKITLSSRLFGVCFLSLSCVSNDIFVALAGTYQGQPEIILGSILSSTIFILSVGVAFVLFYHKFGVQFKIARRPFLRDMVALIICSVVLVIFWTKMTITWWMALVMCLIYGGYLVVLIGCRLIFQQIRRAEGQDLGIVEDENEIFELGFGDADSHAVQLLADMRDKDSESEFDSNQQEDDFEPVNHCHEFLKRLVWDGSDWTNKPLWKKIFFLIMLPPRIFRNLTIPTGVDAQWNKPIVLISFVLSPLFIQFATETLTWTFGPSQFPTWGVSLIVSGVTVGLIFSTSTMDKEPIYHLAIVFYSIIMSAMWIYVIGTEFVASIVIFEKLTKIPSIYAAIFALGWSMSIGTIINLSTKASEGMTNIALFTIWGVPPLKLMLCLGISFLLGIFKWGDLHFASDQIVFWVLFGTIPVVLLYTATTIPCSKFQPERKVAIGYIVLYLIHVVSVLIMEYFSQTKAIV